MIPRVTYINGNTQYCGYRGYICISMYRGHDVVTSNRVQVYYYLCYILRILKYYFIFMEFFFFNVLLYRHVVTVLFLFSIQNAPCSAHSFVVFIFFLRLDCCSLGFSISRCFRPRVSNHDKKDDGDGATSFGRGTNYGSSRI